MCQISAKSNHVSRLPKSFYAIDRYKLINLLENVIEPDELQMIKVLLNKTSLTIKMKGVTAKPFETNVGSPQGDGLGGDLFTVYFEHALRALRTQLNELSPLTVHQMPHQHPPPEVEYADDADFITVEKQRDEVFNQIFSDILQEFNLKSNVTKTAHTVIERGTFETELWRHVRKLGSLLDDREDINRRKQLSIVAMNKYEKNLDPKHATQPIRTFRRIQHRSQTSPFIQLLDMETDRRGRR